MRHMVRQTSLRRKYAVWVKKTEKTLAQRKFYVSLSHPRQEKTTVKIYAVVKKSTLAHIVCCLPCGSEGLWLLP